MVAEGWNAEERKIGARTLVRLDDLARDWTDRYRKPEDRDHLLNGLRKAGLRV